MHGRQRTNLQNWATISDATVETVKRDLLDSLGLQDHPANDVVITTNADGSITLRFKSDNSQYLFNP